MVTWSLILNSRNRPEHLKYLLESIVKTTHDISSIEMIVGMDKDDPSLLVSLAILDGYPFVSYLVTDRPTNLHVAMRTLLGIAQGAYIFILNDDVLFLTDGWDVSAGALLDAYVDVHPDGIVYGRTHDLSVDKEKDGLYSAFPIISKTACNVLNFVMPIEFAGLGGDVATYRIYEKTGRICELTSIILQHTLHQTVEQVCNPDQTAYEMRQNTYKNRMDWNDYNIDDYVWKLRHYINEYQQTPGSI